MRKRKPRGAKFSEGTHVMSVRGTDNGAVGTITDMTKRNGKWCCRIQITGTDRLIVRGEDELVAFPVYGRARGKGVEEA